MHAGNTKSIAHTIGIAQQNQSLIGAEKELAAFISAVQSLYGTEQSMQSAEDWIHELELLNLEDSIDTDWRQVTIAASARLASRVCLI